VTAKVDKLFKHKRWWLTFSYASLMSFTLILLGYVFEKIVTNLRYQAVDKEILSLSNNLHDSMEYQLAIPGKIPQDLYNKIPDLCPVYLDCKAKWKQEHRLAMLDTQKYYVGFLNVWGNPRATVGIHPDLPEIELKSLKNLKWDNLRDKSGRSYRQIILGAIYKWVVS
jgi:hypothetical protein